MTSAVDANKGSVPAIATGLQNTRPMTHGSPAAKAAPREAATAQSAHDPIDDAFEIAKGAGILDAKPVGPLEAQRRALLDAVNAAVVDPNVEVDPSVFSSVQQLVRQSALGGRADASAGVRGVAKAVPSRITLPPRGEWASDYEGAFLHDPAARAAFAQQLQTVTGVSVDVPVDRTGNTPTPELGDVARAMLERLTTDPAILARIEGNLALTALHTQTINHLKHATFEFAHDGEDYPHADVLASPCPFRPTLKALLKALDFERFLFSPPISVENRPVNADAEKAFKDAEQKIVRAMIDDPHGRYCDMRDRLKAEGPNAKFAEHNGTVGYLIEKLKSDPDVITMSGQQGEVQSFRAAVLAELERVYAEGCPHRRSVDAIERALECFDIVQRGLHPELSPALYHSGRYEYYIHYLNEEVPEHINLPTIANLGSTDLLKTRGVPIGFWGVVTNIERVDGFHQTPYEFMMHDVNHDRRMYQFAKEEAARQGISVEQFYENCCKTVKEKLLPLFVPAKDDSDDVKKQKRLVKMILFEILHEDALPADLKVIAGAMLRPPKARTPFERIEENKRVVYFTEEGATTLAYVFRKLAHTFYDVPDERKAFIVTQDLRTRDAIVTAARTVLDAIGAEASDAILRKYVGTDEGLPDAFRRETEEDIYRLAGKFAHDAQHGATDAERFAAAQNLANLALVSSEYLDDAGRTRLAALQTDAAGQLTASARAATSAQLHELGAAGKRPSAKVSDVALAERLADIGMPNVAGGRIGKANVRFLVGDMTLMPVDALLVPQFPDHASVGGIGGAVLNRGGGAGLHAFDEMARKNGPLDYGTVKLVESGSDRWPYLLCAVTVRSGRDYELVNCFSAAVNALRLAGQAGLKAVALPAIATGTDGRLSYRQSARAVLGAIDYLESQGETVPDVLVPLLEREGFDAFEAVFRDHSYRLDDGQIKAEAGEREFDLRRWARGMNIQLANQEAFEAQAPIAA